MYTFIKTSLLHGMKSAFVTDDETYGEYLYSDPTCINTIYFPLFIGRKKS